jgi:hypothetical protein
MMTYPEFRAYIAANLPDVNEADLKAVLHHLVMAAIAGGTQRAALEFLTHESVRLPWERVEREWAWIEENFGDDIALLRAIMEADTRPDRARWQSLWEEVIGEPPPDNPILPGDPLLH